jgi:hypothetical protein
VPYVFAHRELGTRRAPVAVWAKPGWFAYDTMTLVGPRTWRPDVDPDLRSAGSVHCAACILVS